MHAAKNFPARKQVSDIDIALPDGVLDDEYDAVRSCPYAAGSPARARNTV